MIQNFIRLLVMAGAVFAPNRRVAGSICLILAGLAFQTVARAQTGYCIAKVGEDEEGFRVKVDGTRNCDLYQAVKQFPQSDEQGIDHPRQVQMRSIWAANLTPTASGYAQTVIKRSCTTDRVAVHEQGTSQDEIKACIKSGGQAFYYALPNTVFMIPKGLALTPAEMAEKKTAAEAEQRRKEKEAAEAAARVREECEAFRRVREMEKQVAAADARVSEAESRLVWVAEKEWRATALPWLFAMFVMAAGLAVAVSFAFAAYRVKFRALEIDGYVYENPLEAARDLMLKLAAVREESKRSKGDISADKQRDLAEIQRLQDLLEGQKTELSARMTLNASLRRENDGLKRTVETLKSQRASGPADKEQTADILRERCADLDARYNELDQRFKELHVEHSALLASYRELDEAHQRVYQVRDRQARRIMELTADGAVLEEQVEKLEHAKAELERELAQREEVLKEYEITWSARLRASSRPPAIEVPHPAVTNEEVPTKVRVPTLPGMAAVSAPKAESPTVTSEELEPEELFVGLVQELTGIKRQRDIYRQGLNEIERCLAWDQAPDDDKNPERIQARVDRLVAQVFELVGPPSAGTGQETAPPSDAPLPTATQSDIVRITRMAHLMDGPAIDVAALRRQLVDADPFSVAECLKVSIHEWAVRSDREPMTYAVLEPFELYDLNRFVSSPLVCGPEVAMMVPEGFSEAVDRVHLAYAPAFSRRAVMRSMPPPAMPQASG
jgi:hypothetical protein